MPSAREDYLLRMLQQLGEVVRRLRERLTGATETNDAADVEREAGGAITTLLGSQAPLLHHLDPSSAVRIVAGADRVALWTALLRLQADARRVGGHADVADRLLARAAALERAASSVWPEDPYA